MQGENVWRLVRTDRDATDVDGVLDTVGPAMVFFLKPAQPGSILDRFGRAVETRTETAVDLEPSSPGVLREWRVDAARPVQALEVTREPQISSLPKAAQLLGSRSTASDTVLPTVRATKPWYITVRFWWRGRDSDIPYPALRISDLLGVKERDKLVDADWYLDRAIVPADPSPDPGAETFGEKVQEGIEEAAGEALEAAGDVMKVVALVVGLGAIAYIVSRIPRAKA